MQINALHEQYQRLVTQTSQLVSTQTNLEYADIARVKTENDILTQQ